jgi:hypothetical protein
MTESIGPLFDGLPPVLDGWMWNQDKNRFERSFGDIHAWIADYGRYCYWGASRTKNGTAFMGGSVHEGLAAAAEHAKRTCEDENAQEAHRRAV